jgi:hypothetical protein
MKIAIRGGNNSNIGNKILNILENLGGKGATGFSGNGGYYYYIGRNGFIQHDKDIRSDYLYYESLEEYLNPSNHIINYQDI